MSVTLQYQPYGNVSGLSTELLFYLCSKCDYAKCNCMTEILCEGFYRRIMPRDGPAAHLFWRAGPVGVTLFAGSVSPANPSGNIVRLMLVSFNSNHNFWLSAYGVSIRRQLNTDDGRTIRWTHWLSFLSIASQSRETSEMTARPTVISLPSITPKILRLSGAFVNNLVITFFMPYLKSRLFDVCSGDKERFDIQ